MRHVHKAKPRERALSTDEIRAFLKAAFESNIRRQFKIGLHLPALDEVMQADPRRMSRGREIEHGRRQSAARVRRQWRVEQCRDPPAEAPDRGDGRGRGPIGAGALHARRPRDQEAGDEARAARQRAGALEEAGQRPGRSHQGLNPRSRLPTGSDPRRPCRVPRRPAMQQRREAGVVSRVPCSSRLASAIATDRSADPKPRHRMTNAARYPTRSSEYVSPNTVSVIHRRNDSLSMNCLNSSVSSFSTAVMTRASALSCSMRAFCLSEFWRAFW